VGAFIGAPKMNLLDGEVTGDVITCGPFTLPAPAGIGKLPSKVVVGVRPEDVRLVDDEQSAALDVAVAEPLGAETNFLLKSKDEKVELRARAPGFDPRATGSSVRVSLAKAKLHVFASDEAGKRLS
jgi:multiple sugar transport system ATP-binding protein